jgi:hypothetical protein
VLDAYGVLAAEEPPPAEGPLRLPRPDTDLGTHLSYTFQWWVFALGALVGVAVLARREAAARAAMATDVPAAGTRPAQSAAGRTEEAAPGAPGRRTAASSTRPPRRRTARGDEEEDALIDAQLRRAAGDAGAGRPSVPRG